MSNRPRVLTLATLALVLGGCVEKAEIDRLHSFRDPYGETPDGLVLEERRLQLDYEELQVLNLPAAEQHERARAVALAALQHLNGAAAVDSVVVRFAASHTERTGEGIVEQSRTSAYTRGYAFAAKDLAIRP